MTRSLATLLLLVGAGVLSMASMHWERGDDGSSAQTNSVPDARVPDAAPEPVPYVPRVDETWIYTNVFDGQTAVSTGIEFVLTVGTQDFAGGLDGFAPIFSARLDCTSDGTFEYLEATINDTSLVLWPSRDLIEDADYVLDTDVLVRSVTSTRMGPRRIGFSTRSAPRVLGLWRNDDTLILVFSEPMDPDTLYLGQDSVDVLWERDGEIESIAGNHNLAAYVWDAGGYLFRMAPIDFTDAPDFGPVWVKVSGEVTGLSGVPLDGDANGVPGEVLDDYFEQVVPADLPECFTREDIPDPCVHEEDVPDFL